MVEPDDTEAAYDEALGQYIGSTHLHFDSWEGAHQQMLRDDFRAGWDAHKAHEDRAWKEFWSENHVRGVQARSSSTKGADA